MSHQALARRWRPRDFKSLIGQQPVVKALTHALSTGRLHHAYLLTGTRGVGKTTVARILAKALNCETGVSAEPCGTCSACLGIDTGRYVDYIEMGDTWAEKMHAFYIRNGVDPQKIQTCPLLPNRKMRAIYGKTDLGVFPNRCEGGTNLVLMEYMACGKPVVASFSSGHQDILTPENSFIVKSMNPLEIKDSNGTVSAHWDDPSLEEIISQIEFAYHQKARREQIGQNAAKSLKTLTWNAMADRVLTISQR